MLTIYDTETARRTILKRVPLTFTEYPTELVTSVENLFGAGVTLPQAVATPQWEPGWGDLFQQNRSLVGAAAVLLLLAVLVSIF